MNSRRRTAALALAVLAFAAADSALAQSADRGSPPGMGRDRSTGPRREPPFDLIAKDLGLSVDRVREAFREVGPPARDAGPPTEEQLAEHAAELAAMLDVPLTRLRPVLERYQPGPTAQR
jgi:hypothetical protein